MPGGVVGKVCLTVTGEKPPFLNSPNSPLGLSWFKYLPIERYAREFNWSSLSDNPSLLGFPRPNPNSLNALLKSLARDDDSPAIYLS